MKRNERIFARDALHGKVYSPIANDLEVRLVEKAQAGRVKMAVRVPYYGWSVFETSEKYLLREARI